MKWVTPARPKTDRIACPWLIRRFIDPDADIQYVPAEQVLPVARATGGRSFDAPGADYTHERGKCTFEVLIDRHDLGADPALAELARIVHAADIADDVATHRFGAALRAIGEGGLGAEPHLTNGCSPAARSSTTRSTLGAPHRPPGNRTGERRLPRPRRDPRRALAAMNRTTRPPAERPVRTFPSGRRPSSRSNWPGRIILVQPLSPWCRSRTGSVSSSRPGGPRGAAPEPPRPRPLAPRPDGDMSGNRSAEAPNLPDLPKVAAWPGIIAAWR
jgi:hypothetical protein